MHLMGVFLMVDINKCLLGRFFFMSHTFLPGLITFGVIFSVSSLFYLMNNKDGLFSRKIMAFAAAISAMMMCGAGTFAPRILDFFKRLFGGHLSGSDVFTLIAMGLGIFAGATLVRVIRYRHDEKRGKYAILTLSGIVFAKVMISTVRLMV
jgi:hypothetical protein